MENIFLIIFKISCSAGLISLFILLAEKLFSKSCTPKFRYYIWLLVVVRLVLPFNYEIQIDPQGFLKPMQGTHPILQNNNHYFVTTKEATPILNTSNHTKEVPKHIPLFTVVSWIWFLGCCLFLGIFLWARVIFSIQLRLSPICSDERVLTILNHVKKTMNIRRNIPVVYNDKFDTFAIFSIVSPKLILPKEKIASFLNEELSYVFRHELTHYQRKDLFVFGFIAILKAVNWFNPLIWFAFYKMEQECEISCDGEVLKILSSEHAEQYGMTLIKIASSQSRPYMAVGHLGVGKTTKQLKRRIMMISKFKTLQTKKEIPFFVAISLLLVTGVLFLKPVFGEAGQHSVQNTYLASTPSSGTNVATVATMDSNKYVRYDETKKQIIIPKNSVVKTANDLVLQDNYWENKMILAVHGFTEPKTYAVNDELVQSIDLREEAGNVIVTTLSKQVIAFSITDDEDNFYLTAKLPKDVYNHIVVIDPAHGGADSGAKEVYADPLQHIEKSLEEKSLTLNLALEIEKIANSTTPTDIKVYVTRHSDTKLTLEEAATFANTIGGVCLNLHYNTAPLGSKNNGTETFYYGSNTDSQRLAGILQVNLSHDLGTANNTTTSQSFYMIKNVKVPCVEVDVAYLSNQKDLEVVISNDFTERAALSILNGVRDYYGVHGEIKGLGNTEKILNLQNTSVTANLKVGQDGKNHACKIRYTLVLDSQLDKDGKEEMILKEKESEINNIALELLQNTTYEDATNAGFTDSFTKELKEALATGLNLKSIKEVLISDFFVQ